MYGNGKGLRQIFRKYILTWQDTHADTSQTQYKADNTIPSGHSTLLTARLSSLVLPLTANVWVRALAETSTHKYINKEWKSIARVLRDGHHLRTERVVLSRTYCVNVQNKEAFKQKIKQSQTSILYLSRALTNCEKKQKNLYLTLGPSPPNTIYIHKYAFGLVLNDGLKNSFSNQSKRSSVHP